MRPTLLMGTVVALAACSTPQGERSAVSDSGEQRIACTLSPSELKNRRSQLLPGLIDRAVEKQELENGLRLTFQSAPGLLAELSKVIDQERTCCSFLRFRLDVEPGEGPVTFEVSGPPGTLEVLRGL